MNKDNKPPHTEYVLALTMQEGIQGGGHDLLKHRRETHPDHFVQISVVIPSTKDRLLAIPYGEVPTIYVHSRLWEAMKLIETAMSRGAYLVELTPEFFDKVREDDDEEGEEE